MQSVGALTCAGRCGRCGAGAPGAGSRRRRGASEAAIDEARTRLAHAGRSPQPTLIVDSTAAPSSTASISCHVATDKSTL